jgi:hypothetical protein
MALWGRNDQSVTANSSTTKETSNGAPMGTWALVKGGGGANAHYGNTSAGSRASVDVAMFGNTTVGSFIADTAKGIFGVDATEMGIGGGPIAEAYVTFAGSGYGANASVTITVTNGGTSGVVNAHAATGRIDEIKIQTAGSGYIKNPTIAIAAPAAVTFNGTSAVSISTNGITLASANSKFLAGDKVLYKSVTGAPITPLANNAYYYIQGANTTAVILSATRGGAIIDITVVGSNDTGHSLQGETATGYVVSGGSKSRGVTHAGWVLRTEGTGGRAGRVQYETLVAMGSLGAQTAAYGTAALVADASDDAQLPDS